jgi:hypothetical protein
MSEIRHVGNDMKVKLSYSRVTDGMQDGVAIGFVTGEKVEVPYVTLRVEEGVKAKRKTPASVFAAVAERLRSATADPEMVFEDAYQVTGRLCLVDAVEVMKMPVSPTDVDAVAALAMIITAAKEEDPFQYLPRPAIEYVQAMTTENRDSWPIAPEELQDIEPANGVYKLVTA